jgi:hypothetical protein
VSWLADLRPGFRPLRSAFDAMAALRRPWRRKSGKGAQTVEKYG